MKVQVQKKKNDEHMKAHILKRKKKDSHVSKTISCRERSCLQKEYSFSLPFFHTHAHLDLRVWHFSLWILDLTLQHMQYKYAILFIPT